MSADTRRHSGLGGAHVNGEIDARNYSEKKKGNLLSAAHLVDYCASGREEDKRGNDLDLVPCAQRRHGLSFDLTCQSATNPISKLRAAQATMVFNGKWSSF